MPWMLLVCDTYLLCILACKDCYNVQTLRQQQHLTTLTSCRGLMHDGPLGISGLPGWLKTPPQFCPGTMLLAPTSCISCCRARGMLTQDESSCHTLSSARVTNWLGPSLQTQHSSRFCSTLIKIDVSASAVNSCHTSFKCTDAVAEMPVSSCSADC